MSWSVRCVSECESFVGPLRWFRVTQRSDAVFYRSIDVHGTVQRHAPHRLFDCGTLYILCSGWIRTLDIVTVGCSLRGTRLARHT